MRAVSSHGNGATLMLASTSWASSRPPKKSCVRVAHAPIATLAGSLTRLKMPTSTVVQGRTKRRSE